MIIILAFIEFVKQNKQRKKLLIIKIQLHTYVIEIIEVIKQKRVYSIYKTNLFEFAQFSSKMSTTTIISIYSFRKFNLLVGVLSFNQAIWKCKSNKIIISKSLEFLQRLGLLYCRRVVTIRKRIRITFDSNGL